jgi:formyltetrahydrofolate deformylase
MPDRLVEHQQYIFTFQCHDRLGVQAKVTGLFYDCGAYIVEIANYIDPHSERFFCRCVFDDRVMTLPFSEFKAKVEALSALEEMDFQLRKKNDRPRVLIAVSKYDHCLHALLGKWKSGVLPVDIVAVVSNHNECEPIAQWYGLPYYHLPLNAETKPVQEQQILEIIDRENIDLLVLARYMQILSDNMCEKISGKAINIHHSFLPGFKGARPYHQAYERGVKVIGATAHYVNSDLDEGPIIVQEVKPIDHEVSIEQMVHMGHDIESTALTQAVTLHATLRVQMNGGRTVIL